MVDETNFIARKSGRKAESYYIDYSGTYKISDIAKVSGMEPSELKKLYTDNGAELDQSLDVYYFGSLDAAKNTISGIFAKIRVEKKGKLIFLTDAEIEFIRRALISEGSNTIPIKGRIKDAIFKKLNG